VLADIDRAEREKGLAYQVNVTGARNVAESCARCGSRYIFFSSDAVFDGSGAGYTEEDIPHPVNYYGRTKAEAEQAIFQAYPESGVVRISLVLGFPIVSGNSFFANLASKLRQNQVINCPTFEVRTPVDVYTLSECILELCENSFSGLLHIGSTDSINRYELTKIAACRMGFDEALVRAVDTEVIQTGRAPRHKNGVISVDKARHILKTRLLSTAESIDRAFRDQE
jgi:dTDP-4-dehydrorhamnose reductase